MTDEEFQQEESDFLKQVEQSTIYRKMKALSHKIDEDPKLNDLAKRRDDVFERAQYVKGEEKEALLKEFKSLDDEFRADPVVQEYLVYYQEMRKVISHLSVLFTKELRKL